MVRMMVCVVLVCVCVGCATVPYEKAATLAAETLLSRDWEFKTMVFGKSFVGASWRSTKGGEWTGDGAARDALSISPASAPSPSVVEGSGVVLTESD